MLQAVMRAARYSMLHVLVLNEADEKTTDKSYVSLERQLKLLLSRLDVSNVVRTRQLLCCC